MKDTAKSPPVGMCIYCGVTGDELAARGQKLTNEHVMAEGLKTDQVLTAATCPECQRATHIFEQRCLRDLFGAARMYLGAYGKQSEKPEAFPIYYVAENGEEQRILVSPEAYPMGLIMPLLPPPGIFAGRERRAGYGGSYQFSVWWAPDTPERTARLIESDPQRREPVIRAHVPIGDLCKFLAKVAHCLAIYGYWDRFTLIKPFLQDLIRENPLTAIEGPYFVGGAFWGDQRIETFYNGEPHSHCVRTLATKHGDAWYLIARIQLFASLGMPVYEIVIGEIESPPGD